jgi:hypothetical protein
MWQAEALVPDEVFERYVAEAKAARDGEVTSAGLLIVSRDFKEWVKAAKQKKAGALDPVEREALGAEFIESGGAAAPDQFKAIVEDCTRPCEACGGTGRVAL